MIERIFRSAVVRRRMATSHLGIILGEFAIDMHGRGHSINSIQSYVQIAEHFSGWLAAERLALHHINRDLVERFALQHLPHCTCSKPAPTHPKNCRAALGRLLIFLRQRELIHERSVQRRSIIGDLVAEYDRYLEDTVGVSVSTRQYRRRYAREFLETRLMKGQLRLRPLSAFDLLEYVRSRSPGLKAVSLRVLTGALRDFLRFLHLTGRREERCVAAVPTPAPWPRSLLPQTLSKEQARAFLNSFDHSTRTGRRDYAIALCLTQLGLRVREVAGLSLEDIDWHQGTIRLRETKQLRERVLPMPPRLVRAVIAYLRRGRPSTDARALFVRHRAPLGQAMEVHHVRGAMRRAFGRSAIGVTKVHLLRHTFATNLNEKRVGLKAMADVLGHQCLDTTAHYARVDVRELRQAALPWPGDRR